METTGLSSASSILSVSSSLRQTSPLYKNTDEEGCSSIHTNQAISAGNAFAYYVGELMPHSARHTLQMGENIHIYSPDGPAYVNHSCVPNAYFTSDPTERRSIVLVALRDLKKDDEITCDYNATEFISSAPFECHCGQENCIGTFRGFNYLTEDQRSRLLARTRLSPYIEMVHKNREKEDKH